MPETDTKKSADLVGEMRRDLENVTKAHLAYLKDFMLSLLERDLLAASLSDEKSPDEVARTSYAQFWRAAGKCREEIGPLMHQALAKWKLPAEREGLGDQFEATIARGVQRFDHELMMAGLHSYTKLAPEITEATKQWDAKRLNSVENAMP